MEDRHGRQDGPRLPRQPQASQRAPRRAERRQLPRTYLTRSDPFAEVWPAVEKRLEAEPRLLAKTLFDWLRREHSGQSRSPANRSITWCITSC